MRNSILAVLALAAVAGCDSGGTKTDGGRDLSGGNVDLSQGPIADMKITVGCNGYVDCINDCFMNSADTTEFQMCRASTCDKQVTSTGRTRYNAALGCGQSWCLGLNDMGPGDCV